MQLSTIAKPTVSKILRRPAAIYINYPDGSQWEYLVHDDALLDSILRKYGRNIGRLTAALKRFESKRVK